MDKTPEQILQEVSTTNPNDEYLEALDYLLKNTNKIVDLYGSEVSYHFKAWNIGSKKTKGWKLFKYVQEGCGCLTQVKYHRYPSGDSTIGKAIELDDKIPDIVEDMDLDPDQLYRFAQWQTWLDNNTVR